MIEGMMDKPLKPSDGGMTDKPLKPFNEEAQPEGEERTNKKVREKEFQEQVAAVTESARLKGRMR